MQCESEKQDRVQICTGKAGGQEPGFAANGSYLGIILLIQNVPFL